MVRTQSTMLELGTKAPEFRLPDPFGRYWSLDDFSGKSALLVIFLCNHCPYVKHVASELARLTSEYIEKGVAVVAINSNDWQQYPEDAPEKMIEEIRARGYKFPYLIDETQEVAKSFRAACTPDFYVFNSRRELVYRGQMDDSRPGNSLPITGKDLRAALDAVLAGKPVTIEQKPSLGCNIKWRPGNEPSYFQP